MASSAQSPSGLVLDFGGGTDIGKERPENQDAWGKFPPNSRDPAVPGGHLFVVADGMGGHVRGREASQLAVRVVREVYFADLETPPAVRLRHALQEANARVFGAANSGSVFEKMGTTCTALVVLEREAILAHVGDSRAYRVRDGKIQQLTNDHTRVAELHRHGILSAAEARSHPSRSVLTRAIGTSPAVEVDVIEALPVKPGDVYVLCTDGLAGVTPEEMREAVLSKPPQEACDALIDLANRRGGEDNITLQIVRLGEPETDAPATGPAARPWWEESEPTPAKRRARGPGRVPASRAMLWGGLALLLGLLGGAAYLVFDSLGDEPLLPPVPPAAQQERLPNEREAGLPSAPEPGEGDEDVLIREADRFYRNGQPDSALARYKAILLDRPMHLGALEGINRIADAYERQADQARDASDFLKALVFYKRTAAIRPNDEALQKKIAFCEEQLQ